MWGGSPAYLYIEAGPETPVISGPTCFNPNANVVYSASAANAHNFQWTFPSGFSPSTSGGNNLTVYTGNSAGGTIEVYATKTGCPNSEVATLDVLPVPGNVTFINSSQNCLNKGMADTITLSTDCNFSKYEWTLPANWTISGSDTTCSVTVITDGTGGTVSVKAVSDLCGDGQAFQRNFSADGIGQNVTISQYPNNQGTGVILEVNVFGASYQWYQDGNPIAGGRLLDLPYADSETHEYCVAVSYGQCATMVCEDADYTPNARFIDEPSLSPASAEATEEVAIAPNPAENFVEIKVSENLAGVDFTVVSMKGVEMMQGIFKSGGNAIDITKWANGTYLVKYNVNGKPRTKKIQVL